MSVVGDDRLVAKNEEMVCEAVVWWMSGAVGVRRGRGVVGKDRSVPWASYRLAGMVDGEDKSGRCVSWGGAAGHSG